MSVSSSIELVGSMRIGFRRSSRSRIGDPVSLTDFAPGEIDALEEGEVAGVAVSAKIDDEISDCIHLIEAMVLVSADALPLLERRVSNLANLFHHAIELVLRSLVGEVVLSPLTSDQLKFAETTNH